MPTIKPTIDNSEVLAGFAQIAASGKTTLNPFITGVGTANAALVGGGGLIASIGRFTAGLGILGVGTNLAADNVQRLATSGYFLNRSMSLMSQGTQGFEASARDLNAELGALWPGLNQNAAGLLAYTRASARATREARLLSKLTPEARREFEEFKREVKATAEEIIAHNEAIARMRRRLIIGAVAVVAFSVAMFKAAKSAAEFENAIVRLQTQLNISDQAFDAASRQALQLAGDYGIAAKDLADASFAIQSAGLRGAEGLDATGVAAKLAAIQFGDARSAGVLLAGAINAYGKENLDAARAGEVLLAIVDQGKVEARELVSTFGRLLAPANQLRIPLEDIGAAIATYTRLGVPTSEAVNAVRGALFALIKPSAQAKNILEEYGTTVEEVQAKIRNVGFVETLRFLRFEVAKSDEEFARIVPRIRGYGASLALTNKQAELYNEIQEKITNSTGKLDSAVERVQDTTANKWAQAIQTVNVLFIKFGNEILPLVNAGLDTFNGILDGLVGAFDFIFGDNGASSVRDFNDQVKEFVDSFGAFSELPLDRNRLQIEGMLKAIKESEGDIDKFFALIQGLSEFTGDIQTGQAARLLEEIAAELATQQLVRGSGLAGFDFQSGTFLGGGASIEQEIGRIASFYTTYGSLDSIAYKQAREVMAIFRGDAIETFTQVNNLFEELGQQPIDVARIWRESGQNFILTTRAVAEELHRRMGGELQDYVQLAAAAVIGQADLSREQREGEDAARRYGEAYGIALELLRQFNEGQINGEPVIKSYTRSLAQQRVEIDLNTQAILDMVKALEKQQDAEESTGAFANLTKRLAELERVRSNAAVDIVHGVEGAEEAFRIANERYLKVKADVDEVNKLLKIDGKDAIDAQIDAWKEAERVAKNYFENVKDQIDDQQRALDRASEDVIDLINKQFTERFLQVAETANITADERRRIEVRLRAQRDLTLAEAQRELREETRRLEDILEVQEDRRRAQAEEASDAIARLRQGIPTGTPDDPISVIIQSERRVRGDETGPQYGTDPGSGGGTGGTNPPPPPPPPRGDPNFLLYLRLLEEARGLGIDVPTGTDTLITPHDLPTRISVLRSAISQARAAAHVATQESGTYTGSTGGGRAQPAPATGKEVMDAIMHLEEFLAANPEAAAQARAFSIRTGVGTRFWGQQNPLGINVQ